MRYLTNAFGKTVMSAALALTVIAGSAAPSHAGGRKAALIVGTALVGAALIVAVSKRR
jgi:hypothetical protein